MSFKSEESAQSGLSDGHVLHGWVKVLIWLLAGKAICFSLFLLLRDLLPLPMEGRAFRTALCARIEGRCLMSGIADSWWPMWQALETARDGAADIYRQTFFAKGIKFQYPLSSLLPLFPMRAMAEEHAYYVLNFINMMVWGATLLLSATLAMGPRGPRPLAAWCVALLVALLFAPLLQAFGLGQVQVWIVALATGAAIAWQAGRLMLAGCLIGLCCMFKPQLSILLPWALLRGARPFGMGMGLTMAATQLIAVALFGVGQYVSYAEVLHFLGRHGESFYSNHSLFGVMLREAGIGSNLKFQPFRFAEAPHWMASVATLSSLALVALMLGHAWHNRRTPAEAIEMAMVLAVATIASPIAWDHHFALVLPLLLLLTQRFLRQPPPRWAAVMLGMSWLLMGTDLTLFNLLHATPFNFLQAWMLWGTLLLLTTCALTMARQDRETGFSGGFPFLRAVPATE